MKKLKLNECAVLESSNCIWFDCDDTLIMWGNHSSRRDRILITDPHLPEEKISLIPHKTHINILKRNHAQGRTVIVWSAAGYEWAVAVVNALKLEKFVSLILPKPVIIVDDKAMEDWGCMRTYLSKDIEGDV
jgi:hypothetical protein